MKTENIVDNRTLEQLRNLRLLNAPMKVRQVAQNNGCTAELRKEKSAEQAAKLKAKRKQARASRKANR